MDASHVGPEPGESPKARVDRELREMLEEIRVALPGVELLFGFLLILPFNSEFGNLDSIQRGAYLTCFLFTTASVALFVAPTAAHRFGFRRVDKLALVVRTNRQIIAGLALLAGALALAAFLVSSVVLARSWGAVVAGGVALWVALWWFVMPHLKVESRRGPSG